MKTITISNRQMNPGVIHLNQYENSDHQIVFTLDDYMQGTVDLRNCNAYVVTSYGGELDITEVSFTVSGRTVTVTWNVSDWTLKDPGVILFQLRFSQTTDDGVVEWFSHKAVLVNRETINADDFISAKYPTLLQSLLNRIKDISGSLDTAIFYMQPGESVDVADRVPGRLYYQIVDVTTNEGYFEDNNGIRLGAAEDSKFVIDADFDKLLTVGEYVCFSSIGNGQPGNYQYGFLKVVQSDSCNYILQSFNYIDGGNIRTTQRSILVDASTISPGNWTEVATSSDLSALQTQVNAKLSKNIGASNANKVIVTDGSGNINVLADVTPDNVYCLKGLTKNVDAFLTSHDTTLNEHLTALNTQTATLNSHTSTITAHTTKLNLHAEQIGDLQSDVNAKLSKNIGASNANKVIVTDGSGNINVLADVTPNNVFCLKGLTKNVEAFLTNHDTKLSTHLNTLNAQTEVLNTHTTSISELQTSVGGKQSIITGAATTVTSTNLTASRVLVSNTSGKIAASSITTTKLNYLNDVTGNIQAQLDAKAPASYGSDRANRLVVTNSSGDVTTKVLTSNSMVITNANGEVTTFGMSASTLSSKVNNSLRFLDYSSTSYYPATVTNWYSLSGVTSENQRKVTVTKNSMVILQARPYPAGDVSYPEFEAFLDIYVDGVLVIQGLLITGYGTCSYQFPLKANHTLMWKLQSTDNTLWLKCKAVIIPFEED